MAFMITANTLSSVRDTFVKNGPFISNSLGLDLAEKTVFLGSFQSPPVIVISMKSQQYQKPQTYCGQPTTTSVVLKK